MPILAILKLFDGKFVDTTFVISPMKLCAHQISKQIETKEAIITRFDLFSIFVRIAVTTWFRIIYYFGYFIRKARRTSINRNTECIEWTDLALPLEREMTFLMMWIWSLPWSEILVRVFGNCADSLAVGKTCLLNRYIQGTFSSEFYTTIVGRCCSCIKRRELTIVRRLRQSMTKYAVLRYARFRLSA